MNKTSQLWIGTFVVMVLTIITTFVSDASSNGQLAKVTGHCICKVTYRAANIEYPPYHPGGIARISIENGLAFFYSEESNDCAKYNNAYVEQLSNNLPHPWYGSLSNCKHGPIAGELLTPFEKGWRVYSPSNSDTNKIKIDVWQSPPPRPVRQRPSQGREERFKVIRSNSIPVPDSTRVEALTDR